MTKAVSTFTAAVLVAAFACAEAGAQGVPMVQSGPSGPPIASPGSGSRGTFGTDWAKPYPQTGPRIRSDSDGSNQVIRRPRCQNNGAKGSQGCRP